MGPIQTVTLCAKSPTRSRHAPFLKGYSATAKPVRTAWCPSGARRKKTGHTCAGCPRIVAIALHFEMICHITSVTTCRRYAATILERYHGNFHQDEKIPGRRRATVALIRTFAYNADGVTRRQAGVHRSCSSNPGCWLRHNGSLLSAAHPAS